MAVVSKVIAQPGETGDVLLRRFKKQVLRDEVLIDCKKHQYFMSAREKAKFKREMAIKRAKNKKYKHN